MAEEAKATIVVADDDPEIRMLLEMRLKKRGYHVIVTPDGEQTLTAIRQHRPELVVLDVMMPHKNGWEVAKELRKDDEFKEVGIVMLTAIGERMNEMTSPLYGADEYLDKPFEFSELEKILRRVLSAKKKRRSL